MLKPDLKSSNISIIYILQQLKSLMEDNIVPGSKPRKFRSDLKPLNGSFCMCELLLQLLNTEFLVFSVQK